jgi:histidine ammonia-lyase
MELVLRPGQLSLAAIRLALNEQTIIKLEHQCLAEIDAAEKVVQDILFQEKIVYGINTGFGALAHKHIAQEDLLQLQKNIVLSHATGTGELLADEIVRLILLLKINSLARGFSGIKRRTIDALLSLLNKRIYPCIPAQGSVGASGDLAPLAHLSAILIGEGNARYEGKTITAEKALQLAGLSPLTLAPKEGLALLNGTQVSTAVALHALLLSEKIFIASLATGAMSVEAARGSSKPFDARISAVRGHKAQMEVAAWLRGLLIDSHIHQSHDTCEKVQDPYSLRCQPQVMGAALNAMRHVYDTLLIETNAVSDNPLIFAAQNEVLSGGNFHAEPVAFVADYLALALAEIGALAERRIALLIDPHFSHLPAFLVEDSGTHSGFMLAQVTAAALASENKSLAHPAVVDSIPTSANQEDHVSMATFGAVRLQKMTENTACIIAIELLAAAQGIDFLRPLTTSKPLEAIHKKLRAVVPFYKKDRYFAPDIAAAKSMVLSEWMGAQLEIQLFEK